MKIQVNTDNHIDGTQELYAQVEATIQSTLARFADSISRVEVHLSDENGPKSSDDDKRCLMEARLAGRQPIAVSHQGASVLEAVGGAADKLERALETVQGKQRAF